MLGACRLLYLALSMFSYFKDRLYLQILKEREDYLGELHVRTQTSMEDLEITDVILRAPWYKVWVMSECDLCCVTLSLIHRSPPTPS